MSNTETKISEIKTKIETGEIDCLETYLSIKSKAKYFADILKGLEPLAEIELQNYDSNKEHIKGTFKFKLTKGRSTYNFSHIKSWIEKKNELEMIEKNAKQLLEAFTKGNLSEDINEKELPIISTAKRSLSIIE